MAPLGNDPAGLFKAAQVIAGEFTAPRPMFRQFYDSFVGRLRRPELPTSHLQAIVLASRRLEQKDIPVPDPREDKAAFALGLFALGSTDALSNFAMAAISEGLCDPPGRADATKQRKARAGAALILRRTMGYAEERAGRRANRGMMPPPSVAAVQPQRAMLEAIIDPAASWASPQALYPGVLLAIRRLCRIVTRNKQNKLVSGTGFLIGPSAILTNWHVVKDLDNPLPKPDFLRVWFDHLRPGVQTQQPEVYQAARIWRGPNSPIGPDAPDAANGAWWIDPVQREAWQSLLGDSLDYAVVLLDGAPGRQRGWYDISKTSSIGTGGSCWLFHHPGAQGQTISAGSFIFVDGSAPVRAFHSAPSMGGSSGGLLLDDNGQPIALHHGFVGKEQQPDGSWSRCPEEVLNVAIPIAAIAEKIGDRLKGLQDDGRLAPPGGCIDGRRPLFGRGKLLEDMEMVASGARRVLWITPPESAWKKPGKSFSVEVLRALFLPPKHVFIPLTADRVKAGGREMAQFILEKLTPGDHTVLPQPEEAATTETAFFQDKLVAILRSSIADRFSDNVIWLVIDDLDVHDLTDAGGRRFLDVLYKRVKEIPQLRIVLIGLKLALPSIPPEVLLHSPIGRDDTGDIGALFKNWFMDRGARDRPIPPEVIAFLSALASSCAGSEAPLDALARFTTDHLIGSLGQLLGDAG